MVALLTRADLLLRGELRLDETRGVLGQLTRLALLVAVFGAFYGCVMGSFSATSFDRIRQVLYAATKVPVLLLLTFLISVPSFFVLNTLFGMRGDFAEAVAALITTQAGLTIILAALAPFTALWYVSVADYNSAIVFNAFMFAIASFSAQVLLRRLYRVLIVRNARHRLMLRLWIVIYVFVGIQMGWVLRPFVGSPFTEPRFFREGAFSNAYVAVGVLLWDVVKAMFH